MIVREFNQGWGHQIPLKRFESQCIGQYLDRVIKDQSKSVLINSTWYTNDYHQQVLDQLRIINPDLIILLCTVDPAIPHQLWYQEFGCETISVGYYRGKHEIDFWALVCDRYFSIDHDLDSSSIDTAYICLNRKPHKHRRMLYRQLMERGLLDYGIVTMGQGPNMAPRLLDNDTGHASDLAPNPGVGDLGIVNDIMSLGNIENWNRCFLNLVTETVFDVDREWFVSEKIYKPVLGLRPFLVYAPNAAREWITHLGLESYTADFADITDLDLGAPENQPLFLHQLCQAGAAYYQKKYHELRDKIYYNRERFTLHIENTKSKIQQGI